MFALKIFLLNSANFAFLLGMISDSYSKMGNQDTSGLWGLNHKWGVKILKNSLAPHAKDRNCKLAFMSATTLRLPCLARSVFKAMSLFFINEF